MARLIGAFLLAGLVSGASWAAFETKGMELVLTAPVEAGLAADDLRAPSDVWVEMIDRAKKRVDLEQMYAISQSGEPLEAVIAALERAGARGVKVRMLVEKKMERASSADTLARLGKIPGAQVKMVEFGKLGTDGIIHAKYFVVDGREAYVGSQNFDWRALKHIHELGVRITRPALVKQVQAVFDYDWSRLALGKKGDFIAGAGDKDFYVVGSPPKHLPRGMKAAETELVALLASAKKEVVVQLLDYYPLERDHGYYSVIDTAMRDAASRGVAVKLLVSHWNTGKPGVDYLKSLAVLPGVEVRIVTIPEMATGFIPFARVAHSKYMVVDGLMAWVGTSNWTGGYLNRLRNLEVVMKDKEIAERVRKLFDQVWSSEHTAPVDVAKEYAKPKKG